MRPLRPWRSPNPLDGPRLKIERAGKHLEEFDRQIDGYRKQNPYRIHRHEYPETDSVQWTIEARLAPFGILPILAGEVIYQLHSAMHHTAYALSKKPSRSTGFPMMDRCDPTGFQQMTNAMPVDAIKLINGLQPYQRGDAARTDPLSSLAHMRNRDIHRTMIRSDAVLNVRDQPSCITIIRPRSGINDGDVIARAKLSCYAQENLEPDLTYSVVIDEGRLPGEGASTTLHRVYDYISLVAFPVFERFFP